MSMSLTLRARPQDYSILGCLRDHKDELAAACREEVFKRQQDAADDWRTDKELAAACKARGCALTTTDPVTFATLAHAVLSAASIK